MRPLPAVPLALRRLVAALLTLGVLLTSLGWTHSACGNPLRPDVASVAEGHAGMVMAHAPVPEGGADERRPASHCTDHGRHTAPEVDGCAMVAHCAAAVVSDIAVVGVSELRIPMLAAVRDSGGPLERVSPPDSPPPKV